MGTQDKMLRRLAEQISFGLKQKSITKCSEWTQQYRVMGMPFPGNFSFKYHPWSREIHDCDAERVVSKKAAQMGITECALNRTFFTIDHKKSSVLYVLPSTRPDAADFSSSRFDPALDLSPHLRNMFSDVQNTGLKRSGSASLYIRGSHSRGQMKSLPVSLLVGDEVDEMNIDNLKLAFERMSGQHEKQLFLLSTPTIKGKGISEFYEDTTQEEFFFRCPCCNRLINLTFNEKNIVIIGDDPNSPKLRGTYLTCGECGGTLPHETKHEYLASGIWVPKHPENEFFRGFGINQLYSSTVPPHMLAHDYLKAQTNPTDEQEFFNSKLGLEHEVEGARVTHEQIVNCIRDYVTVQSLTNAGLVTMGVDVGKVIHVVVIQWFLKPSFNNPDINLRAVGKLLIACKVSNFEELDALMHRYKVSFSVIDRQPETRLATEFAQRFSGRVRCCHYSVGVTTRQLVDKPDSYYVSVDRTSWLDMSLSRFKNSTIILPKDISNEYKEHIQTLVRVPRLDNTGNNINIYDKKSGAADHYAHAQNYAEIALGMCAINLGTGDITDAY